MEWPLDIKQYAYRYPYLASRLRRGRGLGSGDNYKPWIEVRDFSSRGRAAHIRGIKVARVHHVFSRYERSYLYLVERMPWVVDIREQWPILEMNRVFELCAERGLNIVYRKKYPEPPTVDFMVTEMVEGQPKCRAVAIKTPEDAEKPKVRLRLEVQQAWCLENDIPFTLVTNTGSEQLERTLKTIRSWFSQRYKPNPTAADMYAETFLSLYQRNVPLRELLDQASKKTRLTDEQSRVLFLYCAWSDRIKINLHRPLDLLSVLQLDED